MVCADEQTEGLTRIYGARAELTRPEANNILGQMRFCRVCCAKKNRWRCFFRLAEGGKEPLLIASSLGPATSTLGS